MKQPVPAEIDALVLQFVEWLYRCRTIGYATQHSQMEAWVALEGLELFSSSGWSCWETVGFITGAPVHSKRKKGVEAGIKFPDLVCVRDGVALWWELKSMCSRSLHPKNAGGTFVRDVRALRAFMIDDTKLYLKEGRHSRYRPRDDRVSIESSGLRESLRDAKRHVGIALLFSPGDEQLKCPNQEEFPQPWRPREQVERISHQLTGLDGVRCISDSMKSSIEKVERHEQKCHDHCPVVSEVHPWPRCDGWLISMS